jgi:hypothetical protein
MLTERLHQIPIGSGSPDLPVSPGLLFANQATLVGFSGYWFSLACVRFGGNQRGFSLLEEGKTDPALDLSGG